MSANISLNNILIGQTAATWQEAIQTAAAPLVTNKSITEEYIHQMIESVDKLGPYISIATFKEPIDFHSENGPVSVVMCLACTDRTSHIKQLQGIAEKLMESNSIDKIEACKNKEELYSLFQE